MPHLVKIADVNELPPGKGKTVVLGEREVTVVNDEGRFVASSTWARRGASPLEGTCHMSGHRFDLSSRRGTHRTGEALRYQVVVGKGGVYVLVEDAHVHPGAEPRRPRQARRGQPRQARRGQR